MKSYIVIVVFYIISCTHANNSYKSILDNEDILLQITPPSSTIKHIDTLYICRREGVNTLDAPSNQSENDHYLPYGERIFIISKVSNEYNEDNEETFFEIATDIIYSDTPIYVDAKFLCTINDIKLTDTDICQTYYDTLSSKICIEQKIVHLKLVPNNYLIRTLPQKRDLDSINPVEKRDGKIALFLQAKKDSLLLFDNLADGDDYVEYEYLGFYSTSKSYIIKCSLYESTEICFIDVASGNIQIKLGDYPAISPNNKFVMAVYGSPYEEVGSTIELYKVNENNLEVKFVLSGFKYWSPIVGEDSIYWISDKEVVIKVCHSKIFWQANGFLNKDQYQLLNIRW